MRRLWLLLAALFAATTAHAAYKPMEFAQVIVPGAPVIGLPGVWVPISSGPPATGTITAITVGCPTNFLQSGAGYPGGGYSGAIPDIPTNPEFCSFGVTVTMQNITPLNVLTVPGYYNLGTDISPNLTFSVIRPQYSGTASTTANTMTLGSSSPELNWCRGVLRQPSVSVAQSTWTAATESLNSGNGQVTCTSKDPVFVDDTISGSATVAVGFYQNAGTPLTTASTPTPTINSPYHYPQPIAVWDSPEGQLVGGSGGAITGSLTVAARSQYAFGRAGRMVAGHVFKLWECNSGCTSPTLLATHTVVTPTLDPFQWHATGTLTVGSNVVSAMSTTVGLWPLWRMNVVFGTPPASGSGILNMVGHPEILSFTSTSITLGQSITGEATAQSDGSELIAGVVNHGEALCEAYVGDTISDAGLTGGSVVLVGNATVTLPTAATWAITASSGSTATLTLGGTITGQFEKGHYLILPGQALNLDFYITAKASGTSFTIHCNGSCVNSSGTLAAATSPVATLNGATAGPASATATSCQISTNATGGSGTAGTSINRVWQGNSTGSGTITHDAPVPVYATTFSAAEMAAVTTSTPGFVEDIVYPVRGTTLYDTMSGGSGVTQGGVQYRVVNYLGNGLGADTAATAWDGQGCDFWYTYATGTGGLGFCDSGNPAWYAASGQYVSANPEHDQMVYLDAQGAYTPLHVFIGASKGSVCTANPDQCVFSSAVDPGSTEYWGVADAAAMIAAIKACNGNSALCLNSGGASTRGVAHGTDIGGVVIAFMGLNAPSSTTYAPWAANVVTSIPAANVAPGITYTSCALTTACPGFGASLSAYGGDQTVFLTGGGTQRTVNNIDINNLNITTTSGTTIQGLDPASGGQTAFLGYTARLNDDNIVPTSTALMAAIGSWQVRNSRVDQTTADGSVLANFSGMGGISALLYTDAICTASTKVHPFTSAGVDGFHCSMFMPGQNNYIGSSSNIYLSEPIVTMAAYDTFWGSLAEHLFNGFPNNIGLDTDIFEQMNFPAATDAMNIAGDETYEGTSHNVLVDYTSVDTNRFNNDSAAIITALSISMTTTGGNLNCTSVPDYYVQVSSNYRAAPSTESSVAPANQGTAWGALPIVTCAAAATSTGAITLTLPPDDQHLFNVYVGTALDGNNNITGGHIGLGTVAGSTGVSLTQLQPNQTIIITGLSTAQNPPNPNSTTFPQAPYYRLDWYRTGDEFWRADFLSDFDNEISGIENGGRIMNWQLRFFPGSYSNSSLLGGTGGQGTGAGLFNSNGEIVSWQGTTGTAIYNSTADSTWIVHKDERSFNGANNSTLPTWPGANIGRGDKRCATVTSANVALVPSGEQKEIWDEYGIGRNGSGSGIAGPIEGPCY